MANQVIADPAGMPQAHGVTSEDIIWAQAAVDDARRELDEAEELLGVLNTSLRDQQGGVFA